MPTTSRHEPVRKHAQVFSALKQEIQSGAWKAGHRLPSEAELVQRFGHSRITVGRALRDLQAEGLIDRRVGSGSFVRGGRSSRGLSFGLLIPDLGDTEIFEPICKGMMESSLAREHALLWGSGSGEGPGTSKGERAWHLCRDYIDRRVSGVFFAPLEAVPNWEELNLRIAAAFDRARIPVVLLDRPLQRYPADSPYDLIGIDNRRAGFVITDHLLHRGCRRIAFVGPPNAASTVDAREAGYREALYASRAEFEPHLAARLDPEAEDQVRTLMKVRPDGIVCANDGTAARLMHVLRRLEYRIPDDVRLVGIDDVEYAALLPVPLTTLRQPTRQIGDIALSLMLDRIARPTLPRRDTRLDCELIVRESCAPSRPKVKPR